MPNQLRQNKFIQNSWFLINIWPFEQ